MAILVGTSYYENQLMQSFLENSQQCGKYSAHIETHKTELRREENIADKK